MRKLNIKLSINKEKIIILLVGIIFLFLILGACKEKGNSEEDSEKGTEKVSETSRYFDEVLDNSNPTGASAAESDSATKENSADESGGGDEETQVYAEHTCGDGICTYYETYSSCPDDCKKLVDTTLADYPTFLEDGTILVVGDSASSTDVITATVIGTYLITKGIKTETKLASEVEDTDFSATDLILIGSPCDNAAISKLLHYTSETCKDIITQQNNAVIKLIVSDTNEIIIITGYDSGDTKVASAMLTSAEYNLNGAEEWINLNNNAINIYFSKN